jgi:hypothetical protein
VTPVKPVESAGQAGGYSSRTTSVPESLNDFSRPWNKTTPKTQPALKENPTQNLTKQLQTDQKLTSSSKTQRHMSQSEENPTSDSHRTDRSRELVKPV